MSTPRLSSLSFQALSLLLERQRLRTLGKAPPATQLVTIKRIMETLREGILELEKTSATEGSPSNGGAKRNGNGVSETRKATEELRSQWQRARRILVEEGTDLEDLPPPREEPFSDPTQPSVPSSSPFEVPFRDEPSRSPSPAPFHPSDEMQVQRQMMDDQDTHLDTLSHSIQRQRELSENIGNELDVHTGLLEDLESGLDNTAIRLGGARRKLDKVAKGARDNCSAVAIGALILILLILIIIFKT